MNQLILKTTNNSKLLPLIHEALEDKSSLLLIGINRLQDELTKYEEKLDMDSEAFYHKYQSGKMGDSSEVIDWAGKFEILLDLKNEYQSLKEIEICA